jgi:selT/selW/selH-like putative selenoprotein
MIEGRGGVFEVTAGSKLIFSKKATHRFPENEEILELLAAKP